MNRIENCICLTSEVENAQWAKDHTHVCPICGNTFTGYGNNPYPIAEEGRCCDDCNRSYVLPMRILLDRASGYIDDTVNEMMMLKGNKILFGIQNEVRIEGYRVVVQTIYMNRKTRMICITEHPMKKHIENTFNNYVEHKYNAKNVQNSINN